MSYWKEAQDWLTSHSLAGALKNIWRRIDSLEDTPPGSAAWGSIAGTLANQTDLDTALSGKSDTTHNHNSTYLQVAGQIGGSVASPDIRGLRETSGATLLSMGAVADGEYLKRDGTDIVGDTPAGGSGGVLHDTQANRPAAGTDGRLFIPEDGHYPSLDNGVSWDVYAIPGAIKCVNPPSAASFSQIHFSLSSGSASLAADGDGLLFTQSGNNSTSNTDTSCAVLPIPVSGAYSLIVGMELAMNPIPYTGGGICLTDGNGATPKILTLDVLCQLNSLPLYFQWMYLPNPTTGASAQGLTSCPVGIAAGKVFLKIYDDRSANLVLSLSTDGRNWIPVWTIGRTTYFTPAYAGITLIQAGASTGGGAAVPTTQTRSSMRVFHWSLA